MTGKSPPEDVVVEFEIEGMLETVERLGRGHIHETWVSRFRAPAGPVRFVHQRINRDVFAQPERVMANIDRVTRHLRAKLVDAGADPERRTLTIVRALDGRPFHRTERGEYWRTYRYIEGTRTFESPRDEDHVFQVSRAFGSFLRLVEDLGPPPLFETIRGFGDTRGRFERFAEVLEEDPERRAAGAVEAVEFARLREPLSRLFGEWAEAGRLPRRIAHHDTKINNVLIDRETGEGICVIDLDTVMEGTALFDFGDSVRFAVTRTAEDEPDPRRVKLELPWFEALVRGYLEGAGTTLESVELDHLTEAAIALTYVAGLRFLTDHLSGDRYFGVTRPGQNLDRCRAQFALVREMEEAGDRMAEIVRRCRGGN